MRLTTAATKVAVSTRCTSYSWPKNVLEYMLALRAMRRTTLVIIVMVVIEQTVAGLRQLEGRRGVTVAGVKAVTDEAAAEAKLIGDANLPELVL